MAGTDVMGFCIAWHTIHHVGLLSCTCWFQHQAIRTSVLPTWQAYEWNKVTPIKHIQGPLCQFFHEAIFSLWCSLKANSSLQNESVTHSLTVCMWTRLHPNWTIPSWCLTVFLSVFVCIKVHTSIVHHFCKLNPVCVCICWSPGDPDRGLLHRVPALLLWWRWSNKHSWKRRHLRFPGSTAVHQRGLCTHLR